jgi:hypothetical protein
MWEFDLAQALDEVLDLAPDMSVTGENAKQASDALLAFALAQPEPGVGGVLRAGDALASLGLG